MPAPVAMESVLVPSSLEGAAFPDLPGAAGVIAMSHYRRRGKMAWKNLLDPAFLPSCGTRLDHPLRQNKIV
jgi:hypothetical protein